MTTSHLYKRLTFGFMCLFLILCTHSIRAQVISVDTLTAKPSSNFPFDAGFTLKYSVSNAVKISQATLFKVNNSGCKVNIIDKACRQESIRKLKKMIDVQKIITDKEELKYYDKFLKDLEDNGVKAVDLNIVKQVVNDVYVEMPALEPNTGYRIYLFTPSGEVKGIDEVIKLIDKKDLKTARSEYKKIQDKYVKLLHEDKIGCERCNVSEFKLSDFEMFVLMQPLFTQLLTNITTQKDNLDTEKKNLSFIVPKTAYKQSFETILKDLVKFSAECSVCIDSVTKAKQLLGDKTNILLALTNLQHLHESSPIVGYTSIDQFNTVAATPDDKLDARLKNLEKSVITLQMVQALTEYHVIKNQYRNSELSNFKQFIADAIVAYNTNITAFKAYQKAANEQIKKVNAAEAMYNAAIGGFFSLPISGISSDTYTYNFVTRAGYRIKSDFGLLAYGNPWHSPGPKGVLPYVGFHVNLRPMNTDIPFSKIPNKDILSYLSLNAGVLIGNLEEEGKREGLIGKTSVFMGLGINVVHEFRFVVGGILYNKLDLNPLNNSKSTAIVPFAGLSIDFRLEDIYKGVKKLFEP